MCDPDNILINFIHAVLDDRDQEDLYLVKRVNETIEEEKQEGYQVTEQYIRDSPWMDTLANEWKETIPEIHLPDADSFVTFIHENEYALRTLLNHPCKVPLRHSYSYNPETDIKYI